MKMVMVRSNTDRRYVTEDGVTVFISSCRYCKHYKSRGDFDGVLGWCDSLKKGVSPSKIDSSCMLAKRYEARTEEETELIKGYKYKRSLNNSFGSGCFEVKRDTVQRKRNKITIRRKQILVDILDEHPGLTSKELYEEFNKKYPISFRNFRSFLREHKDEGQFYCTLEPKLFPGGGTIIARWYSGVQDRD